MAAATAATSAPTTHFLMKPSLSRLPRVEVVTRLLPRVRRPAHDGALRPGYGPVQGEAEDRGDEDSRPGGDEVEDLGVRVDEHAERVEGAAEVLADDRADHREDTRHLERGEDEWQR